MWQMTLLQGFSAKWTVLGNNFLSAPTASPFSLSYLHYAHSVCVCVCVTLHICIWLLLTSIKSFIFLFMYSLSSGPFVEISADAHTHIPTFSVSIIVLHNSSEWETEMWQWMCVYEPQCARLGNKDTEGVNHYSILNCVSCYLANVCLFACSRRRHSWVSVQTEQHCIDSTEVEMLLSCTWASKTLRLRSVTTKSKCDNLHKDRNDKWVYIEYIL